MMFFLKSPVFGNSWQVRVSKKDNRNLSGELLPVVNQNFAIFQGFKVSFSAVTLTEIQNFINFLISSAGHAIQLTDFEGATWQGIILESEIQVTRGRGSCNYETSFSFEGVKI